MACCMMQLVILLMPTLAWALVNFCIQVGLHLRSKCLNLSYGNGRKFHYVRQWVFILNGLLALWLNYVFRTIISL